MGYCKINLNPAGTLSPGDSVHGTVICVFTGEEKVREIECSLEGQETTKFSKKRERHRRWYTGKHVLFKMKISLHGQDTMQPGSYEYPFSFTFPSIAPGSFQDKYANIRYFVTAIVDRPFALDYYDELTIHVNSPINLNLIRQQLQMEPLMLQDAKTLCCWCCVSPAIQMTLVLEKNAFIVGEVIKLKVDLNNPTGKNIEQLQIQLKRCLLYHCDGSSRTHFSKYPVTFTNATGIGAHSKRVYLIDFEIPAATRVDNLALCTLIKDYWLLEVEAVLPGCRRNLSIPVVVILGHIPLDNYVPRQTLAPTAPTVTPTNDNEDIPPSYYEATRKEEPITTKPSAPLK